MTNRFTKGMPQVVERSRPLHVGFIPLNGDRAPLVYAHESGLFQRYELDVELKRETRWATIRDKVKYGELTAAHAPATLPFISNLELEAGECPSASGMVLSLQGNAITLSRPLWDEGVRDAETLRQRVYRDWGRRTYTFAVVFPHSPQYFLLRRWLKTGGIVPHNEVRIIVPPARTDVPHPQTGLHRRLLRGRTLSNLAWPPMPGPACAWPPARNCRRSIRKKSSWSGATSPRIGRASTNASSQR